MMLKSLNEEDHNNDYFSENGFTFYFQTARPSSGEERQTSQLFAINR